MRVLVIGGTGNISSGVVAALLDRNHQIVVFNRGQAPDAPPPDVQVIRGDRRDHEDFVTKLRVEKFDVVLDMVSFDAEDVVSRYGRFAVGESTSFTVPP